MSDNDDAAENARALSYLISSLQDRFPDLGGPPTAQDIANIYATLAAQMELNVSLMAALVTPREAQGFKESRDRALWALKVSNATTSKALQGFLDKRSSDKRGKDGDDE